MVLPPLARMHGSQKQRLKVGLVHLTILLSDPLVKFVLLIPHRISGPGLWKGLFSPEDRVE